MIMIPHSRPVGPTLLTWGFPVGAGDGNRTRIISLGICYYLGFCAA